MNMNKALQNLYHAVSNETTTKVNISKLLVDIHYAITGKESANKNNWSKIINSMADNWPEGGGGSSDFSTATVTYIDENGYGLNGAFVAQFSPFWGGAEIVDTSVYEQGTYSVVLYKGLAVVTAIDYEHPITSVSGDAEIVSDIVRVTGDCTITIS